MYTYIIDLYYLILFFETNLFTYRIFVLQFFEANIMYRSTLLKNNEKYIYSGSKKYSYSAFVSLAI